MRDFAETRKEQMRASFNALVPDYDTVGPGCFAYFGQRLVAEVGIEPGQRVLDVATGRGAVLFPAAERVGASGEVIGVDLAEAMVQATSEEATRRGLRTEVRVMDAELLDFPDAVFDRLLCGFGIMFFPNRDRALGEFRRVLKVGKRLGVSTWRVSQTDDLEAVFAELGLDRPHQPGWITEPDELKRLLEGAAFTDVRVVVDSATFRYADVEEYWQTARGTGFRRALDGLDAVQGERVRSALTERLHEHQGPDGIHVVATALLAVATR